MRRSRSDGASKGALASSSSARRRPRESGDHASEYAAFRRKPEMHGPASTAIPRPTSSPRKAGLQIQANITRLSDRRYRSLSTNLFPTNCQFAAFSITALTNCARSC